MRVLDRTEAQKDTVGERTTTVVVDDLGYIVGPSLTDEESCHRCVARG